ERAAQSCRDQIAHEGGGDDDGAGTDHAHGDRDQELALAEPARLLDEAFLEERYDDEAATERERAGLQEEREELAQHRAQSLRRGAGGDERHAEHERRRRRYGVARPEEGAVGQDADDRGSDEDRPD